MFLKSLMPEPVSDEAVFENAKAVAGAGPVYLKVLDTGVEMSALSAPEVRARVL